MHYIFITDSYYPSPSPNAICVEKIIQEVISHGDTAEVVALRTFPQSKLDETSPNVHIIEPDWMYSALTDAKYRGLRNKFNFMAKLFRIRGFLNAFFWPLMSLLHLYRYTITVRKLLRTCIDDVTIIGVYKSLEAACSGAIAKKLCGKGFYALYTLDAVSGGIIPTVLHSKHIANRSIKRWERFLFSSYDALFVMESHKGHYMSPYYDKWREKITYLDIPLLKARTINRVENNDNLLHFVFTGGVSSSTANPSYFIELLDCIGDTNLVLDIYGKIYDNELKEIVLNSKYVQYHGVVTHDEAIVAQNNASFLLNFGNTTPCAIPCKIFEYFSTGNPVISCVKIDNDASKDYIQRYPCALTIDERLPIQENSNRLINFIKTKKNPIIDVESLFYKNSPKFTFEEFSKSFNKA